MGEDHPRSRGVYIVPVIQVIGAVGSSPLARGLRMMKPRRSGRGRIIPARAGFTTIAAWGDDARADHPRSRGVYGAGTPTLIVAVGIIPARAGFTVAEDRREDLGGDHPRSRGVYFHADEGGGDYVGSSPLARGLRGTSIAVSWSPRIIPARAGFT